jgi:hypothetical protein
LDVTELYCQLALLTDANAIRCLDGVLAVSAAPSDKLRKFYGTEQAVIDSIAQAAQLAKIGDKVPQLSEDAVKDKPAAIRVILVQIASDKQRRGDLATWLQGKRDTLFEPITAALVLAGIVFVLQLDIAVEIKDGKVSGHVKKGPTDSKLLEKFFSLFK